ncbi:MAG: acyl-CoA dehydrogenase [Streptosporangiales bacterium]
MTAQASTSAVDTDRLRSFLDGRWEEARQLARGQLRAGGHGMVYGLDVEAHRRRVADQLRTLAGTPIAKLGFPREYGGAGDVGGWISGFAMLSYSDLSLQVKAGVQWGLFGSAIANLGTKRHHEEYLPAALNADVLGSFAMTETGHGSDVQSIETTATYDADAEQFTIHTPEENARKDYIGGAARDSRFAVVFAQLVTRGENFGVHAFVVPIRTASGEPCPGVMLEDCGHKEGLNGVDNGRIHFDHVRVPREALLNRYADVAADGTYQSPIKGSSKRFFTMLGTLVQGRISVASGAGTATKLALAIAVRYAESRRQFHRPDSEEEVPIIEYLQHQRRLLPALATAYALHFAHDDLIASADRILGRDEGGEHELRQLESHAAGLKALITWHTTTTIQECREACGGAGYMSENQLPQLRDDTDVFTTFEGDNTVLLQLVAKGLLTGYRNQFGDLDTRGTVRFVAGQVFESLLEATSAHQLGQRLADVRPGREETDLLDRGYQLDLLRWREQHVLGGLARRMKAGLDDKRDPSEVFNEAQDHVLLAARAHMDRVVLEAFATAVDRCEDRDLASLLARVCDLHALSLLERERAWFLEHDRFSPGRAKATIRQVNELCASLRPYARALVDGFGIPEVCVTAPIAHQGG